MIEFLSRDIVEREFSFPDLQKKIYECFGILTIYILSVSGFIVYWNNVITFYPFKIDELSIKGNTIFLQNILVIIILIG